MIDTSRRYTMYEKTRWEDHGYRFENVTLLTDQEQMFMVSARSAPRAMKLLELEPRFHRYERRFEGDLDYKPAGGDWGTECWREFLPKVETLAEAQGIFFLCPACFTKNGGPVGTHGLMVTFEGRGAEPQQGSHNRAGAPSRWTIAEGSSPADLTLRPSIDCGCWHGYITNGEATNA